MSTPHIALLGAVAAIFFRAGDRKRPLSKKLMMAFYIVFLTACILLLVRGTGVLPETLQQFPIFSAFRVPERFLFILSLLVSLGGVWGAARLMDELPRRLDVNIVAPSIGMVTILGFLAAYAPMLWSDPVSISLPYNAVREFEKRNEGYLQQPVRAVFESSDNERVSDFHYLFTGSTGTQCYEALPRPYAPLRNGPVEMVYDGAFNIYNPSCLQYPEANRCSPGDRVRESDRENFLRFIQGRKTTWMVSPLQRFADWLTMLGLLLFPVALLWLSRKELSRAFHLLRAFHIVHHDSTGRRAIDE